MTDSDDAFGTTLVLLRRARDGDRPALESLLDRYADRLLARIRMMMGPEARRQAESGDFLHGVFIEILRDFGRSDVRDECAFLRWATGIARNNIRDAVRRRRERALTALSSGVIRQNLREDDGAAPPDHAARIEDLHRLAEAIETLRDDDRRIIELRDLEGLSYRQIAEQLGGGSEGAIQMRHARALARLTRFLAG